MAHGGTAQFKWDLPSRVDAKFEAQAAALRQWAAVCKAVDLRDKRTCRCCGRHADPNAIGLTKRADRHHIIYRSAGGRDETSNLITLCAGCHDAEHRHQLDVRGDADIGVEFWSKNVEGEWFLSKREVRPFLI